MDEDVNAGLIRDLGESLPGEWAGKLSGLLLELSSKVSKLETIVARERQAAGFDLDVLVTTGGHGEFVQYHLPDDEDGRPLCHIRINPRFWEVKRLSGVLRGEICKTCLKIDDAADESPTDTEVG